MNQYHVRMTGRWSRVGYLTAALMISPFASIPAAEAAATISVQFSTCPAKKDFQCITEIGGLMIRDVEYRMNVLVTAFQTLDPRALLSWGDTSWANAASAQIVAAINSVTPGVHDLNTRFYDSGRSPYHEFILHIPTQYRTYAGDPQGSFDGPCPVIYTNRTTPGRCSIWLPTQRLAFAMFTPVEPKPEPEPPVSVPEPSTLLLLGVGLAGLVLSRKTLAE